MKKPVRSCPYPLLVTSLVVAVPACRQDAGMSIRPLERPSVNSASQAADPALAVVPGSGDVVLSWIEGDSRAWGLYVARSSDGGSHWSQPVHVAGGPGAPGEVHPHGESSPRLVVASEQRMALVWPNSIAVPGRKWPAAMLRFAKSEDGGRTWSRPITLNDDTTGAPVSHQFHGATWTGDSGLAVAWLDERHTAEPIAAGSDGHADHAAEPDATIYTTSSKDFGKTWNPNRVAWRAACPCCRVTLARDPGGQAIAAWRKHFPGNVRDVVISNLSESSSELNRVYPDDWSYPGCPHSGPGMAIGSDGTRHVVWYNGKEGEAGVYYTRSAASRDSTVRESLVTGRNVSTAHPTVVALANGGALAAYDVTADGKRQIGVARLSSEGRVVGQIAVPGSENGKYPQLAMLSDTAAVVAWTSSTEEKFGLRLARIEWR